MGFLEKIDHQEGWAVHVKIYCIVMYLAIRILLSPAKILAFNQILFVVFIQSGHTAQKITRCKKLKWFLSKCETYELVRRIFWGIYCIFLNFFICIISKSKIYAQAIGFYYVWFSGYFFISSNQDMILHGAERFCLYFL